VPDIQCPACGTASDTGAGAFCPWCGLELGGSEAAELQLLTARLAETDRELWDVGARRSRLAADLAARQWSASRGASRARPARPASAEELGPQVPAPRSPEWSIDSVRSLLLWVGAALLAASALTFTAVAWTHLGDGGRALLLLAVTVLSVAAALGLVRRLPATAEAFTALSIALALIDWHALRRAGLDGGMSATTWWALGAFVVSAFAFVLGTAVGERTTRVTMALLLPLSLELAVGTVAGAAWSGALGFALIAGVAAFAWSRLRGRADVAVRVVLATHAVASWFLAAIVVLVATLQADTVPQALTPAAVVLTLALAPAGLLRRAQAAENFALPATLVCAAPLGSLVVVASTTFGGQAMLAWATIVATAAIVMAPSLPRRWTRPACAAGIVFAAPGLAYGVTGALVAVFGPLAWVREPWHGSLASPARAAFAGPRTPSVWRFGWSSVVALGAVAVAIAAVAVPARRRRPLVSVPSALAAVATLAALAACLAPIVARASAGVAGATATAALCALLAGVAVLDRSKPQAAITLLSIAILPAIAATGWAALTPTASNVVLSVTGVVLVLSTAVAASDVVRRALGAGAGAAAISLAGVATAASGRSPAVAGFAVAIAAGVVVIAGVHGRWHAPEGVALESVGAAGLVVGVSIAGQQVHWLAGALTASVPLLVVAGLRRERAPVYLGAAGAAALGATWAWLAAAHVTVAEAYTAPAAAAALAVGVLAWQRGPARSWLALGPAIVLGLGPTLVIGIARDDTTRTVLAAVLALAVVGSGAARRLQAPLVLGSVALLTLAVDTFGPAVVRLPRWLPLAVIGVLLMWIGATFEKRRDSAERATRRLLRFG
jgi:hypothetical protein